MSSIQEDYKLTVLHNGKRYAVMAHLIDRDESIFVRSRKKENTALISSGVLVYTDVLKIDEHPITHSVGNQLHYHPSGAVRRKENGAVIKNDRFYPLTHLPGPIALFKISPPDIEWFDEAKKHKKETIFDLAQIQCPFTRLDFQIWIGPKSCFENGFRPDNTYASIIFNNEVFYDVAYFIREMEPLEDKLNKAVITAFPETNIQYENSSKPELWVGCLAVSRQIRLFMHDFIELNNTKLVNLQTPHPKLFHSLGYHIRMSICVDGIIGAVGPLLASEPHMAGMEWRYFNLPIGDVLKMLVNRPCDNNFIDISKHKKEIPINTLFFRTSAPVTDTMKHEIVVVATEAGNGYYRLPNAFTLHAKLIQRLWINECNTTRD